MLSIARCTCLLLVVGFCHGAPQAFDFNAILDSSNPFVVQAQPLPDPRQQQPFITAGSENRPTIIVPDSISLSGPSK